MCQRDPSKSLVGQETPATNCVLQFDTGALKIYRELGKYFSKYCVNMKSKDAPHTAKGVRSRFVPPDRVRRSSPHIDKFRKSATADFRHLGRRWIVDKNQSYRWRRLAPKFGEPGKVCGYDPALQREYTRAVSARAPPVMGAARVHMNRRR
jgi:hypothetical protein